MGALDPGNHPEHLDTKGLMVCLQPRPHANTGSRFSLVSAYVEEMEVLEEIVRQCSPHGDEILRMHQVERAALRAESGGTADYAFCLAFATNDGPHALPGDEGAAEQRYARLCSPFGWSHILML